MKKMKMKMKMIIMIMKINKNNKKKRCILDEIIDKSKSFEEQIKSLKN